MSNARKPKFVYRVGLRSLWKPGKWIETSERICPFDIQRHNVTPAFSNSISHEQQKIIETMSADKKQEMKDRMIWNELLGGATKQSRTITFLSRISGTQSLGAALADLDVILKDLPEMLSKKHFDSLQTLFRAVYDLVTERNEYKILAKEIFEHDTTVSFEEEAESSSRKRKSSESGAPRRQKRPNCRYQIKFSALLDKNSALLKKAEADVAAYTNGKRADLLAEATARRDRYLSDQNTISAYEDFLRMLKKTCAEMLPKDGKKGFHCSPLFNDYNTSSILLSKNGATIQMRHLDAEKRCGLGLLWPLIEDQTVVLYLGGHLVAEEMKKCISEYDAAMRRCPEGADRDAFWFHLVSTYLGAKFPDMLRPERLKLDVGEVLIFLYSLPHCGDRWEKDVVGGRAHMYLHGVTPERMDKQETAIENATHFMNTPLWRPMLSRML